MLNSSIFMSLVLIKQITHLKDGLLTNLKEISKQTMIIFTIRFIWACFKTNIYLILGSTDIINTKIVQYFAEQTINPRNKNFENLYRLFSLVMNNASVHFSSSVQTFYNNSKLNVITILLYNDLSISPKN